MVETLWFFWCCADNYGQKERNNNNFGYFVLKKKSLVSITL